MFALKTSFWCAHLITYNFPPGLATMTISSLSESVIMERVAPELLNVVFKKTKYYIAGAHLVALEIDMQSIK